MNELEKIVRDANDLDRLVDMAVNGQIPMQEAFEAFNILTNQNPKAFAFGLIRNMKSILDDFDGEECD